MIARIVPVFALLACSVSAQAATVGAVVDGVQMPAWVERNGQRTPLAPGQSLLPSDRVVTGDNAKLLVRMPEGSLLRLGEKANLNIGDMAESRSDGQRKGFVNCPFAASYAIAVGSMMLLFEELAKHMPQCLFAITLFPTIDRKSTRLNSSHT